MRVQFTMPTKLDGKQLIEELNAANVICDELPNVDLDNVLWLNIEPKDETTAAQIIAAHIPAPIIPLTPAEKLFNATGLTVAEYKALGL